MSFLQKYQSKKILILIFFINFFFFFMIYKFFYFFLSIINLNLKHHEGLSKHLLPSCIHSADFLQALTGDSLFLHSLPAEFSADSPCSFHEKLFLFKILFGDPLETFPKKILISHFSAEFLLRSLPADFLQSLPAHFLQNFWRPPFMGTH